MPKNVNVIDPAVTREDVIAAIRAMSQGRARVNRIEWNTGKPSGYPTTAQIQTRWGATWSQFLRAAGLRAKCGPRHAPDFIRDKAYYRERMRDLASDGVGLRRREWDEIRNADAGELSSTPLCEVFGGWSDFLAACGLKKPPRADEAQRRQCEAKEIPIVDKLAESFVPEEREEGAQPLRLVANDAPSKRAKFYCPVSRTYYSVTVYGGGRFE